MVFINYPELKEIGLDETDFTDNEDEAPAPASCALKYHSIV